MTSKDGDSRMSQSVIELMYDDGPKKSRMDYEAERILKRIIHHDSDNGGVYVEVTGAQGAGKTGAMLGFMEQIMTFYKKEKIFWSSSYKAPLQFLKLGEDKFDKIVFLVKKDSGVVFRNRKTGKLIPLDVKEFTDFDDLYRKAEYQKCNAVFFGNRFEWMDFIEYLRSVFEWSHVFIDEFGEVAPSDQSGEMWSKIKQFSEVVKEVRKCDVNLFTNSQSATDVDYRIRKKIMIKIFLPGASADNKSRIRQSAIDNLMQDPINGNFGYLEYSGKFGRMQFSKIYKPPRGLSIEAIVLKNDEDEKEDKKKGRKKKKGSDD